MFGAALHFLILVVLRLQYSDTSNFSSQIIFHFCHSFFHSSLILGLGIQTSIMVALVYCWTKYVGLMNYTKRMAIARSKWLEFFISNFGIWHMQCNFFFQMIHITDNKGTQFGTKKISFYQYCDFVKKVSVSLCHANTYECALHHDYVRDMIYYTGIQRTFQLVVTWSMEDRCIDDVIKTKFW